MNGARVVLVVLLCVLGSVGGVTATEAPAPSMSVLSAENTSEYLTPGTEDIDRTSQKTAGLDVAGAVSTNVGEVRATYHQTAMERSYRNAETESERRTIVAESADSVVNRSRQLESKAETAVQRYGAGEIDETELTRTVAMLDRNAEATVQSIRWLEVRADRLGMDETEKRLASERVRLLPLQGPVRGNLDNAISGDGDIRVHIEVNESGLILAQMADGGVPETYLREAHDPDARTVNIEDRYGGNPSPALDRIEELYPWVTENGVGSVGATGPALVRLYVFEYSHPHGELETYLDSGSADILYEVQRNDPEAVPTTTRWLVQGDLRVQLNSTRGGGPLGVSVVDETTDQRVDAEVEIDGDSIGSTEGGELWTVAPRGATTINATHDGQTVTYETDFE